ncbi:MAG: hypothetical protein ACRD1K_09880, partial [Acidimicrobiales bacterium]
MFVSGPVAADTPETFVGSAAGKALDLKILGQSATIGVTTGKVTSARTAVAEGAGLALLGGAT